MTKFTSDFKQWHEKTKAEIEAALKQELDSLGLEAKTQEAKTPTPLARLLQAMGYSLLSGGKRLRPLLCIAAAEAVGGEGKDALPAALAVEMIHAYSLIHDDLPQMDNDDWRRGQPTCHIVFGEALALLAGDALQSLAFSVLTKKACQDSELAAKYIKAAHLLAGAIGPVGMVGGQVWDLALENSSKEEPSSLNVATEDIRQMNRLKTGELIAASLTCGAILGGGTSADTMQMRSLGLALGLAFQIKDDLLNLVGDPEIIGKGVGTDAQRGKATLLSNLGQAEAEVEYLRLSEQSLAEARGFGEKGRNLVQLIGGLVDRQA